MARQEESDAAGSEATSLAVHCDAHVPRVNNDELVVALNARTTRTTGLVQHFTKADVFGPHAKVLPDEPVSVVTHFSIIHREQVFSELLANCVPPCRTPDVTTDMLLGRGPSLRIDASC